MAEMRFVWIPREEDLEKSLDGGMFSHKLVVKNVFGILEMYEQKEYIQGRMLNDWDYYCFWTYGCFLFVVV